MATTTVRQTRPLQRHRIVERPRLLALLDDSSARIRMLVAPAGYGKTTLAEQWVRRDGRRGGWFTARSSATDVAALALGMARAAKPIVPDCDMRLREHLRAVPAPVNQVEVLAEILAEDIAAWPENAWLVVDEYQEVARSADAERFVASLVEGCPLRVLIASRQRPSWVSARGILYGEVLELSQTVLAMDSTEAADVLSAESTQSASGLVALANGWPAVIGLAAVSGADIVGDVEQVPESLYRFFAEEVYAALDEQIRAGLAALAVAPLVDRAVAEELLGSELAEVVCSEAIKVGILVERGSQLELHPLCRSFLDGRGDVSRSHLDDAAGRCVDHYLGRGEWDAAFEVVSRHALPDRVEALVRSGLDELLETARLSTIQAWCDLAASRGLDAPVVQVARAEVALRRGRYAEAQSHAEATIADPASDLTFRALSVAGRAAHLASREEDGLELYRRAEAAASNEAERRDAMWGQFICAVDLEAPDAGATYADLMRGVRRSDPRDVVRAAAYGLSYQVKTGRLDLSEADAAFELIDLVPDALVVSSFQSTYSVVLGLSARYEEALDIAEAFLATARAFRLEFAVPYALCSTALACAGLRRWKRARLALDEVDRTLGASRNTHAGQLGFALRSRLFAQQGQHFAALAWELPPLREAIPSARAEVLSSRALVLASAGRIDQALGLIHEVRGTTRAVEPVVLAAAVEAVCAMKSRDPMVLERVAGLEDAAFETGAVDLLVTAYRANPDLLGLALRVSSDRDRLASLVRRVGDDDVAATVGQPVGVELDPTTRLSRREREVYDLLVTGISDREIAARLFISESTAKRHAHHIYDKLGIRSRTALAVQAALARADQATAATATGAEGDSELPSPNLKSSPRASR